MLRKQEHFYKSESTVPYIFFFYKHCLNLQDYTSACFFFWKELLQNKTHTHTTFTFVRQNRPEFMCFSGHVCKHLKHLSNCHLCLFDASIWFTWVLFTTGVGFTVKSSHAPLGNAGDATFHIIWKANNTMVITVKGGHGGFVYQQLVTIIVKKPSIFRICILPNIRCKRKKNDRKWLQPSRSFYQFPKTIWLMAVGNRLH